MNKKKLIDEIWDLNTIMAQYDTDIYDLLKVGPGAYNTLIEEYKDLFIDKENKRTKVNQKTLEDYFGVMIVIQKELGDRFRLEKDI